MRLESVVPDRSIGSNAVVIGTPEQDLCGRPTNWPGFTVTHFLADQGNLSKDVQ